ncbi:ATP-NAD/AcoX kinase [Pyrolobus fumarii 1A]|uniref:ATP-NAD/AcoX kinase n=1 Tax=Pyrolobus fumarii (strain DSM 11204 / 1A) TaxID=694429 RepID=G0EHN9_PYRF1|nr:NAD(+)/NADH kinase [Pyrolobus fumarii]AEM39392.1 ATP-NAD/AcoX kinase [Pyrolobus fumarii 1A]
MARILFLVNPIAGLGGPRGLRGTDEDIGRRLLLEYRSEPPAYARARRFLARLRKLGCVKKIMSVAGGMGAELARSEGFDVEVVYESREWPTRSTDTVSAVMEGISKGVDIVVFVGGDGTARLVADALVKMNAIDRIVVLGVPAGVKMYSSIFGVNPEAAADALCNFLVGRAVACEGEVVDVDEEAFRRDELRLKLYALVKSICAPGVVGISKQPSISTSEEEENKLAIARYIVERMEKCSLYILGPGSTVAAIAKVLGKPKTLLGVDVYHGHVPVALNVDEETLYKLVTNHPGKKYIIVTPIGGQGFILGRGNQQISPRVIRAVGVDNVIVVATWSKIRSLRYRLRVDTGDPELDDALRGYRRVVVDYNEEVVAKVE